MWHRCVGHTKIEVCDKKKVSQGDFNGVHIHENKRVNVEQDRESFLYVTGVCGLVKLFENALALKEKVKSMSWTRKSTHGVPPKRVGELALPMP